MSIESITVRDDRTGKVLIIAQRKTEEPELSWHVSGPLSPSMVTVPFGTLAVMKKEVRRLARISLGNWSFTTTVKVSP